MKKLLSSLLAITFILLSICPVWATNEPYMKFTCMSDMHLDDILIYGSHSNWDQFRDALKSSYGKGYSDLFVCVGDVSSYGRTSVWSDAWDAISNAGFDTQIWALGNHAYGTASTNLDADSDFKKFIGKDSIYYHEVINGCHFICMGVEQSDLLVLNKDYVYSEKQENWVRAELAKASEESKGKPIFVLSHYPLTRTRLTDDLAKYDNVFFFWGHSHDDDWEDYTIDKYINSSNGFTTSRVGSTQYGRSNAADALLVDVYHDKVVLTVDRTDGKKLSPDSITVDLTLPYYKAFYSEGNVFWYAPDRNDVCVCICSYNDNGQVMDIKVLNLNVESQYQECSVKKEQGLVTIKVFFVDSKFAPIIENSGFDVKVE